MSGQRFTNVAEVMVLVKLDDGTEHGWVINRPIYAEWDGAGLTDSGSARGRVTIGAGEFFRKWKNDESRGIEVQMHQMVLEDERLPALGNGDEA